jgi:hypothetical protein
VLETNRMGTIPHGEAGMVRRSVWLRTEKHCRCKGPGAGRKSLLIPGNRKEAGETLLGEQDGGQSRKQGLDRVVHDGEEC